MWEIIVTVSVIFAILDLLFNLPPLSLVKKRVNDSFLEWWSRTSVKRALRRIGRLTEKVALINKLKGNPATLQLEIWHSLIYAIILGFLALFATLMGFALILMYIISLQPGSARMGAAMNDMISHWVVGYVIIFLSIGTPVILSILNGIREKVDHLRYNQAFMEDTRKEIAKLCAFIGKSKPDVLVTLLPKIPGELRSEPLFDKISITPGTKPSTGHI